MKTKKLTDSELDRILRDFGPEYFWDGPALTQEDEMANIFVTAICAAANKQARKERVN